MNMAWPYLIPVGTIGGLIGLKYLLLLNSNSIINYHNTIFDIIIGCLEDPVDDVCGAAADVIKSLAIGIKKTKIDQEKNEEDRKRHRKRIIVNRRTEVDNNDYTSHDSNNNNINNNNNDCNTNDCNTNNDNSNTIDNDNNTNNDNDHRVNKNY